MLAICGSALLISPIKWNQRSRLRSQKNRTRRPRSSLRVTKRMVPRRHPRLTFVHSLPLSSQTRKPTPSSCRQSPNEACSQAPAASGSSSTASASSTRLVSMTSSTASGLGPQSATRSKCRRSRWRCHALPSPCRHRKSSAMTCASLTARLRGLSCTITSRPPQRTISNQSEQTIKIIKRHRILTSNSCLSSAKKAITASKFCIR